MKHQKLTYLYIVVLLGTFFADRFSKYYVLNFFKKPYSVNALLTCDVTFNRGISWNMFHSHDATIFWTITIIVSLITAALAAYALYRWFHNYHILGEVFVISGAFSNIIDRFMYGGVVDFIACTCGDVSFPIFNLADVFIVIGVAIMFVMNYKNL